MLSFHAYGISFFTLALLLLSMTSDLRSMRFLFDVFLVRIWLAFDFEYITFPLPVTFKRFAAPRFVFILGIERFLSLCLK
jgi:hypothetical protein